MSKSIGFIGLGAMGRGMALNLLRAGFELCIWNRSVSKMDELVEEGAIPAENPADLAHRSEISIVCVSDTPDVESVILGQDGIIHGVQPGSLVIDTSTISPKATRRISTRLEEGNVYMLDAPISGGPEGAAKGTLSIMVGGDSVQVRRAMPVLEVMGDNITHVGNSGDGQLVKLVNQILVVGNALTMSEALLFAQSAGLDLHKTLDAVSSGAAGSWMLSMRGPQILERDWRPGFTIDLQLKDLRIALTTADELGVPVQITSIVFHYYRLLQEHGLGSEGNHALIKALERLTGIVVGAHS